jgi:hypothetical protein
MVKCQAAREETPVEIIQPGPRGARRERVQTKCPTRDPCARSNIFLGKRTYRLADGSTVPSQTFRIKSLKVGDKVLESVTGSIAPVEGSLLLGQSFLSRFKSWSIDNQRHLLVLE